MPIACPVCAAANEAGPACRRCRADLSLLFALEDRRRALLAEAARATRAQDWDAAAFSLDEAERLRKGEDLRRMRAVVCLLRGDFAGAWREYRAAGASGAGA